LPGILSRLNYLRDGTMASLEWNAILLLPIYPSPMWNFGYDIADYCEVDPRFSTLAHFDALVRQAHRRGLRVIMDFVLNHTSGRSGTASSGTRSGDTSRKTAAKSTSSLIG
jgi:alpha-glucosidase